MTADTARRRSPLHGVALPDGLRELAFLAQLDVRLDPADGALLKRIGEALGVALPVEPNAVGGDPAAVHATWLGPDEWLVVGPDGAAADLEVRIRAAAGESPVAVVDVSANRTTLELARADARAILAGGCSIDLHPRAFGPGRAAQTLVSRAGVILHQTAAEPVPTFRLLVRPSFAAYLAAWLSDAIAD